MKFFKNPKLLGLIGQAKGYVAGHIGAQIAIGAVALTVVGGGGTAVLVTQMNKPAEIQQVEAPAGVVLGDAGEENNALEPVELPNVEQGSVSDGKTGSEQEPNVEQESGKNSGNGKNRSDDGAPATTEGIPAPITVNPIVPEPVKEPPVVKTVQAAVSTGSSSSGSSDDNYIIGEGPNGPVHIDDIDLDHVNVDELPNFNLNVPEGAIKGDNFFIDENDADVIPDLAGNSDLKYTIMIYLCGSDLESGSGVATADLKSIINSCYASEKVNVVVLAGGATEWKNGYMEENNGKVSMYEMVPAKTPKGNASEVALSEINMDKIASYGKKNMGDPKTLAGFMNYVAKTYPAEHTGLILWNHGGGVNSGVCSDENHDGNSLTVTELQEGLANTYYYKDVDGDGNKKLDWISCDACLMSNFEVALKLSPYGDYYIASEEIELGGWDYNFLRWLTKGCPDMDDTKAICKKIAEMYMELKKDYTIYTREQDLNVIDLSQAEKAAEELQTVAKELITYAQSLVGKDWVSEFVVAQNDTARFGDDNEPGDAYDLVDLKGLMENLSKQTEETENKNRVIQRLDSTKSDSLVAAHYNTEYEEKKNLNGISIYFPFFTQYATTYSEYNVIPSWTVLMEKFSKAYKRTMEDSDLLEMVKSCTYDKDKAQYVVTIEDVYWNDFLANIGGIEVAKVRQALQPDEEKESIYIVNATTDFIPCPLYRINEGKRQIIYRMSDLKSKTDSLIMLNHMPVAVFKDEDGQRYIELKTAIETTDEDDTKTTEGIIKCYLKKDEIEVEKVSFSSESGEEGSYAPQDDGYSPFIKSIKWIQPRLRIVEKYTETDTEKEVWQVDTDIWGVKMTLPIEDEEQAFLFTDPSSDEEPGGNTYRYDGIIMQLMNREGTKQFLPLYIIGENYESYSDKITNQYTGETEIALFGLEKETVSQNSVSENSVSQNAVTEDTEHQKDEKPADAEHKNEEHKNEEHKNEEQKEEEQKDTEQKETITEDDELNKEDISKEEDTPKKEDTSKPEAPTGEQNTGQENVIPIPTGQSVFREAS